MYREHGVPRAHGKRAALMLGEAALGIEPAYSITAATLGGMRREHPQHVTALAGFMAGVRAEESGFRPALLAAHDVTLAGEGAAEAEDDAAAAEAVAAAAAAGRPAEEAEVRRWQAAAVAVDAFTAEQRAAAPVFWHLFAGIFASAAAEAAGAPGRNKPLHVDPATCFKVPAGTPGAVTMPAWVAGSAKGLGTANFQPRKPESKELAAVNRAASVRLTASVLAGGAAGGLGDSVAAAHTALVKRVLDTRSESHGAVWEWPAAAGYAPLAPPAHSCAPAPTAPPPRPPAAPLPVPPRPADVECFGLGKFIPGIPRAPPSKCRPTGASWRRRSRPTGPT